jgi:hypothetical protein
MSDPTEPSVGRLDAIPDYLGAARNWERCRARVIGAKDNHLRAARELRERFPDFAYSAGINIEMILLDVGDDGDCGRQRVKRAIVFIRLDDEELVRARAQVSVPRSNPPTGRPVGSRPAERSASVVITVVVVLP